MHGGELPTLQGESFVHLVQRSPPSLGANVAPHNPRCLDFASLSAAASPSSSRS